MMNGGELFKKIFNNRVYFYVNTRHTIFIMNKRRIFYKSLLLMFSQSFHLRYCAYIISP